MLLTGEASHRLAHATEAKAFPFPWSHVNARSQSGKKKMYLHAFLPSPKRIPSCLGKVL